MPKAAKNPFHYLRVSTKASNQEVMARSREKLGETFDHEEQIAIRTATEQIVTHPNKRTVHAAWEMPDTDYATHDEIWRQLKKHFVLNPVNENLLEQAAETFTAEHLNPDALLKLLVPLFKVRRPSTEQPVAFWFKPGKTIPVPVDNQDLF